MTTMTAAVSSKLPLWRTIAQAYALWAGNFPDLLRTVWVWMLVMAPVVAITTWWQVPHLDEMLEAARAGKAFADPNPVLTLVTQIVSKVITLPAISSVAVAWHRLLLKDEHSGGVYLRLDRIVAGYAILAFFIGVIGMAPSYLNLLFQAVIGASAQDTTALVVQTLAGLMTIVVFFIVTRLSLALPALALGRDDVTLAVAWRASKRNSWRMVWAYFFCIVPAMAANGAVTYWLFQPGHSQAAVTLASVVMSLMWFPLGMISVGMLSLAYRHFFERGVQEVFR
jgi:hypothetical protein